MIGYRISQLAERVGLPASTLRFYEQAGLLTAERTTSGYRVYGQEAVQRLEFIASAKHLGLPLEEIRELLQIWQEGVCAGVRSQLLPQVRTRMDQAQARIAEVSAFSAHLAEVHQRLSGPAPAGACVPGCGCISTQGQNQSRRQPVMLEPARPTSKTWQPVACSLDAASMSGRTQDWQGLMDYCIGRETVPDGLSLTFPAEPALTLKIARLAMAEQECCAFFDFNLHLSPAAVVLTVRAPQTGAALLADLFGAPA